VERRPGRSSADPGPDVQVPVWFRVHVQSGTLELNIQFKREVDQSASILRRDSGPSQLGLAEVHARSSLRRTSAAQSDEFSLRELLLMLFDKHQ